MGYTATFKSHAGKTCVITIGGGGTPVRVGATPFYWEEESSDDLLTVFRHRSGYINLEEDTFGALDDLHPDHSTSLPVSVSYDGATIFNGFVQAQSFSNPYAPGPNVVSIPIVSPLGVAGERTLQTRISAGDYIGMRELSINTGDLQNYLAADGTWATATTSDVGRFVEITPGSKLLVNTVNLGRVALVKTTSNIGGARADFATGCDVVSVSGGGQTVLDVPSDAHYVYVAMKLNSSSPGTSVTEMSSGAVVGIETIGSVMKEVCTALGISSVIIPKALLQDNVNPMHVYVSKRILSPYNSEYNFGENDLFSPISYEKFLEGVCNLYGLIVHDTVDANGDSVLTFGKVGYSGTWLKMAVSTLDDTSVTGTEISQPTTTFFNGYDIASADGHVSYVRPIGRLDIEHGDKIDSVNAALGFSSPVGEGGGRVILHPVAVSDGGEFVSQYLSDDTTVYSEYHSDMVRLIGDGEEKIDIAYRAPHLTPLSYTPLLEYIFAAWPRTKFDLLMETEDGLFSYRVQIESGGKYASGTTVISWVDTPTFLSFLNNNDNEYLIENIPPTDYPVIVRLFPNPTQSEGLTIFGDPVKRLLLTVKEANPLNKYYVNLDSTTRTIKRSGEYENANIDCLFHDFYDNLGRIIGGSLAAQDEYDYLFATMKVLKLSVKRKSALTLDMSRMYLQDITIDDVSGWRVLSVGFDPWDDVFDFVLFKVADSNKFNVVTNFENVTSNAPSRVDAGSALSVTLTGTGSNKVQENSVVVMMGGVNVTSSVYNHSTKTITIAEVTDNVSITAVGRPYDAEVEWLQSDGTAYIDTGFKHNQDTRFACKLEHVGTVQTYSYPFGSLGGASGSNKLLTACINGSSKLATYYGSGTAHAFNISGGGVHTFDMNKRSHKVDATTYSFSSRTFSSSYNTLIFGITGYDGTFTASKTTVRFYYFQIYDDGTLVRDFVPVKNNGVGYLYDKVSGQLFGNANSSGAFTYGNEV